MPDGFLGDVASEYLKMVERALQNAIISHNRNPAMIVSFRLPHRRNVTIPHPAATAYQGSYM